MTGVQTCALPICFPVTIKEESGFRGTGGDWRYIELCLHSAVNNANELGVWHGIYKPFSVPAIGFKITKE